MYVQVLMIQVIVLQGCGLLTKSGGPQRSKLGHPDALFLFFSLTDISQLCCACRLSNECTGFRHPEAGTVCLSVQLNSEPCPLLTLTTTRTFGVQMEGATDRRG